MPGRTDISQSHAQHRHLLVEPEQLQELDVSKVDDEGENVAVDLKKKKSEQLERKESD